MQRIKQRFRCFLLRCLMYSLVPIITRTTDPTMRNIGRKMNIKTIQSISQFVFFGWTYWPLQRMNGGSMWTGWLMDKPHPQHQSYLQIGQVIWGQPSFFSTGDLHFGHLFAPITIAHSCSAAKRVSLQDLPSCHGSLHVKQAVRPHFRHSTFFFPFWPSIISPQLAKGQKILLVD